MSPLSPGSSYVRTGLKKLPGPPNMWRCWDETSIAPSPAYPPTLSPPPTPLRTPHTTPHTTPHLRLATTPLHPDPPGVRRPNNWTSTAETSTTMTYLTTWPITAARDLKKSREEAGADFWMFHPPTRDLIGWTLRGIYCVLTYLAMAATLRLEWPWPRWI